MTIGTNAFELCRELTNAAISSGTTSIGDNAFYGSGVATVTIPASVAAVGTNAFGECFNLSAISVDTNNPDYSSLNGVLFNKNQTTLIQYPCARRGGYIIPGSVTAIDDWAFKVSEYLAGVVIADGITNIGTAMFEGCFDLTNVTIPESVTAIGPEAFQSCGLTSVVIPGSVASIGDNAFVNCIGLTNVTLLSGVVSIGDSAFDYSSVSNVTLPASIEVISNAFALCRNLTAIDVDTNNPNFSSVNGVVFDKSGVNLIDYPCARSGSYAIPDGVISIGSYAFADCFNLTDVTIPGSVTSIGSDAFYNCGFMTYATVPNSVVSIGAGAFEQCDDLRSITIPAGVTNIGSNAFVGCGNLAAITVDSNNPVYSSVNGVLFDKSQTTLIQFPNGLGPRYTIPDTVTNITAEAFADCNDLTTVTIPGSVTSIGDMAFGYCLGLRNLCFEGSPSAAGSNVFLGSGILGNGALWPSHPTCYYLPGATGWDSSFAGLPAVKWNARIQTSNAFFGVWISAFEFEITGTTNIPVEVDASTDLASFEWTPVAFTNLSFGWTLFRDAQWTNYPARFYRVRFP
jgi:hypothetical protein